MIFIIIIILVIIIIIFDYFSQNYCENNVGDNNKDVHANGDKFNYICL